MKYAVNENCIGCGLCVGLCPEVFAMTDEGVAAAVTDEVPETAERSAAEAAESCPVDALEEL